MTDRATRDRLCEQWFPLVQTLAKRAKLRLPPSIDLDDLVGIGAIALLQAATRYDPARHNDTPFDAYARRRIYGAMISAHRWKHWKNATCDSLDSAASMAVSPDYDSAIDRERKGRAVAEVVELLPARERTVIREYYGRGQNNRQVSRVIELSQERVGQLHRGALVELRRRLAARRIDRAA